MTSVLHLVVVDVLIVLVLNFVLFVAAVVVGVRIEMRKNIPPDPDRRARWGFGFIIGG